jgi:hypothetical protein
VIDHWLQGGPCDGSHIYAEHSLPERLHLVGVQDEQVRELVVYERVSSVEQLDAEHIYYPAATYA